MRILVPLAAAASALTLSACATTPMEMAAMGDMTPEQAGAYVGLAAASDMYEIESSRLALTRSQDANIRQFAQMMIDHHTQTSAQLMAAARTSGITTAPKMLPPQVAMIEALQRTNGQAFDRLYRTQQLQAHEMAVALHGNYARDGDTAALRQVAAAATPIVTQHLAMVRQMPN